MCTFFFFSSTTTMMTFRCLLIGQSHLLIHHRHFRSQISTIGPYHLDVCYGLAYSTELLVCINHSKKHYKQRGGENSSLLNSTHSSSPLLSLVSLCVFTLLCHHYTALQWAYIYIYIQMGVKGHKSSHDLCHRLCPPPCVKWEIRYSHLHMVRHCLSPFSNNFQVYSQYETLRLLKIQVEKQFMSFILDTVGDKI